MSTRAKLKRAPKRAAKAGPKRQIRANPKRAARIEVLITPENMAVIERAAEIQGRTVKKFVAAAAREVAHREIEQTHIIRLSVEDHKRFMEALRNPPEPNDALRRAFESHKRLIQSDV
jgi:uncharacterized protein (DUF1778 family)